jgi:hypothetical protein
MDSSLRAFRSASSALTISSDMATIILFIIGDTLHIGTHSNLYTFRVVYCYVWRLVYGLPEAS